MSTPSSADRNKASRLRKKATLTSRERAWLDAYTARQAARAPAGGTSTPPTKNPATPPVAHRKPTRAQQTQRDLGSMDASRYTYIPVAPPVDPSAPPPPPGVTPPLAEGSPFVATDAPAAAAPPPPNTAAQQFATIVVLVCHAGLNAARELLTEVPPEVISLLSDERMVNESLGMVHASALNVAMKWLPGGVPYGDELVVGGALAGSVAAVLAVHRRKLAAKDAKPVAGEVVDGVQPARPDTPTPQPVSSFWAASSGRAGTL